MTGILIMNKPDGFTSFDVIAKLRGICKTRRIGHSGTLDPMATGVLPVFVGEAAKAVDMQLNHDKVYEATFELGKKTDTGDITGNVIEADENCKSYTEEEIIAVLPKFVGEGMQLPPMYSAVKINGQPLYKAARAGKTVERTPRPIVIHSIDYVQNPQPNCFTLRIHCGKGTYVRVLLEDIAKELGTIGTMTQLCRTQAGVYTIEQAKTFEEVQKAKDVDSLQNLLISVDTVFMHLPAVYVDEATHSRLLNGAPTYKFKGQNGEVRIYEKQNNTFLGLGRIEDNTLHTKKLFVERSPKA